MRDLIYYYPLSSGAPSEVARSLFSALLEKNPLFNITIFPQNKKYSSKLKEKYVDIPVVSIRDLLFYCGDEKVIHFSVNPNVFPNRKFLLYLISLFKHNKIIINFHAEPRKEFKIRLLNKDWSCLFNIPNYILVKYILKNADVVVVNSVFMQELFKSTYGSINIKVIPNGIDVSWLQPETSDDLLKENKIKDGISIFYHGRLAPEKGIDILLKAFYKVLNERPQIKPSVTLYIAGDGPQKILLEKLSEFLKIDKNVVFLGHLEPSLIKSYLRSVNAAVYPSVHDAFSLAVLEAFSSVNGPVFYSCNIGINGFVQQEGYRFYTFAPTVEGTANAIKFIVDKIYDPTISNKQKEFADKFTWDKVAQSYIDLYNEIV